MGWGLFIWLFHLGSRRCKRVCKAYPLVEGPRGIGGWRLSRRCFKFDFE